LIIYQVAFKDVNEPKWVNGEDEQDARAKCAAWWPDLEIDYLYVTEVRED